MKNSRIPLAVIGGIALTLHAASAQVLFSDDFEAGMGNWTMASSTLDWSSAQNVVPVGGQYSALLNSSLDRMYHNLGSELSGAFIVSYYLYDDAATRAYGEVRSDAGAGYNDGALQQLFAIGKYSSVTFPGDTYDATKYQGRVTFGANVGWFNLNEAGVPSRSAGWHRFDIERLSDESTINFYVDGVLGRTITGATIASIDTIVLGSVAAGSSAGDAYFDGVLLTVPEPSTTALFAVGGGLLLWGLIRRRH